MPRKQHFYMSYCKASKQHLPIFCIVSIVSCKITRCKSKMIKRE
eukprot:UN02750